MSGLLLVAALCGAVTLGAAIGIVVAGSLTWARVDDAERGRD